ncbi:PIR Superfamily Protein [Plasmodium ovale wallikeri]|uniref:PIR Superfamily Protein n=1 Tax=Plasmodium ovale wallikeri TaxID=864142 RepID=A0A1A9ANF1_PLAOA|nr:PIR Superfamily Protein [Plasmodium ovale wallikeri]SBT58199.1 PIR Superfamily Protein [Plasmodium ovale wallikeri]
MSRYNVVSNKRYSFVSTFHVYKDSFDKANEEMDTSGKYLTLLKETYSYNTIGGCKYLNNWIQNKLLNNIKNKYDTLGFYQNVMHIYDYLIDTDTCDGNIENIDEDIFGKVKTLYEVYDNFNRFRNPKEPEIGENCASATKSVTLYI